jgi:hypothetical protein
MKEDRLVIKGFKRIHVKKEESGDKDDYYYYVYSHNGLLISSNTNLEAKDDDYTLTINIDDHTLTKEQDVLLLDILLTCFKK